MSIVRERADALPDYVLATPPFLAAVAIEDHLNRQHELRLIGTRVRVNPAAFRVAMQHARAVVAARPFPVYGPAFLHAVSHDARLTPQLLLMCLERRHGRLPLTRALEVLNRGNDVFHQVRAACLDLFDAGPPARRRGPKSKPSRDGIDLNAFVRALLKAGIAWSDVQTMTLSQALLVLCGDPREQELADLLVDSKIRWLGNIATAHGLTLVDFGRMSAPGIVAFVLEKTGNTLKPDDVYPLLEEPEFQP